MLYRSKEPKRSRVTYLLAAGTIGIGVWVGAYLAFFQPELSPPQPAVPPQPLLPRGQDRYVGESLAGYYLAGRLAASEKEMGVASDYMAQAIHLQSDDPVLLRDALHTLVAAGRMEEAAQVAGKMIDMKARTPLPALVQIAHLAGSGQFAQALPLAEIPQSSGLYAVIKPVVRQWLVMGRQMPIDKPVIMPDLVERSGFLEPFMHYQLALMNDVSGHAEVAREHYEKALGNPEMMPYRIMRAACNFYLRQGERDKAIAIYNAYARQNPDSELMEKTLPQADLAPEAVTPMVETPAQGLAEIFFTTASLMFGEQISGEAMVYLQLTLFLRPDMEPAHIMLANLYEQMDHHALAIQSYRAISPKAAFYKRAQLRMAMNYYAMGDSQKAVGLLKQLQASYPDDPESYTTMGDLMRVRKDFKEAIVHYSEAIKRMKERGTSDWSAYYARGICYERSGQWDKAEEDFAMALAVSPQQADVMNYLGYSWLVQGKHLKRARHYIEQALEQRPSDAHIVDSMGWAMFVMGNFKRALHYMEQAADLAPQDATVNEHLGDVYWRLGRRIEAKFQWERALTFGPEDAATVEKKIRDGLPEYVAPTQEQLGEDPAPATDPASAPQQADAPASTQ